jgi:hypothetical protein
MKMLTKIEKLDQRFPGLADQVRDWFNQGASVREVSELLFLQYNIYVPRTTVGNFRARRWARDQEILRQTRMTAAAAEALLRELERKDPQAANCAPFTVSLTSFFLPGKNGRLQTVADSLVEMSGRLLKM